MINLTNAVQQRLAWLLKTPPSLRHCHSFSTQVPVVIAGAGPTGLTLSLLLSKYGIKHVVLEKHESTTNHPQAHFFNNRTVEVFSLFPDLAGDIYTNSPRLDHWRKFIYCESLLGELIGEVDHFPGQAVPNDPLNSPHSVTHLSQHRLLPLMMKHATAASNTAQVVMGQAVTTVRQDTGGVEVTSTSPSGAPHSWHCRYLLAADGAHSKIRSLLGVSQSGTPVLQHLINVHFVSHLLGQVLLAAGRPAMLYFVFNPQVVMVLVAHNLEQGEFVAQVPFFPPLQSLADFTPEVCSRLVRTAVGGGAFVRLLLEDLQVLTVRDWVMSAVVADVWQQGRTFLLGDAAHRFPPAGGFGMNTGVQDAHNLAWKIAAVERGIAGWQCLSSYAAERRPVAQANSSLSVANWHEVMRVPASLGLDPRAAEVLRELVSKAPLPGPLGKVLLEGGLWLGRRMSGLGPSPLGAWRRDMVTTIIESGETLRLQFPQEDLGFRYRKGALLGGEWQEMPRHRGDLFVPSTAPGSRMPHCWLIAWPPHSNGTTPPPLSPSPTPSGAMSSLDLIGDAGVCLILFVPLERSEGEASGSVRLNDNPWVQAGVQLRGELKAAVRGQPPPLNMVLVHVTPLSGAADSPSREELSQRAMEVQELASCHRAAPGQWLLQRWADQPSLAPEGVVSCADAIGMWRHIIKIDPGGAVLVRPDGHVAWRSLQLPGSYHSAYLELQSALQAVLCRPV